MRSTGQIPFQRFRDACLERDEWIVRTSGLFLVRILSPSPMYRHNHRVHRALADHPEWNIRQLADLTDMSLRDLGPLLRSPYRDIRFRATILYGPLLEKAP